ncbi:MAG: hypothetical protein ACLQIQ_02360 [Beijerinckiaceae bacterium]
MKSGPSGAIALTHVDWAGARDQQIIIGWRLSVATPFEQRMGN